MPRRPNRDSPVPLYHQIVESVRYRIATGQIRPGDALPPLRDAARQFGVHMHTVRRAYSELAGAGLAVIRRPQGAKVASTAPMSKLSVSGLADFLADTVRTARKRFGVDARGLAGLLLRECAAGSVSGNAATFVECSRLQAEDYAHQVERFWNLSVAGYCLDAAGEPPPGPILSTYFHFNDVRRRWPHRLADLQFVSVTLDPALVDTLTRRGDRAHPTRVILVETNAERARDALADLTALLPADRVSISVKISKTPADLHVRRGQQEVVLLAPRLWAKLDESARARRSVVQLRYLIEPSSINTLGEALGWLDRGPSRTRPI